MVLLARVIVRYQTPDVVALAGDLFGNREASAMEMGERVQTHVMAFGEDEDTHQSANETISGGHVGRLL